MFALHKIKVLSCLPRYKYSMVRHKTSLTPFSLINNSEVSEKSFALGTKQYACHSGNECAYELYKFYPEILNRLIASNSDNTTQSLAEHIKECLEYVTFGSKMSRFRAIIDLCTLFDPYWMEKEENEKLLHYIGWCLEIINISGLIADDFTDGGVMRRNKPCWHLQQGVGPNMIFDVVLLLQSASHAMESFLKYNENSQQILQCLREFCYVGGKGQSLDKHISTKDVSQFNLELYKILTYVKTSYNTTYQPFKLVSIVTGKPSLETVAKMKPFLLELGMLYQYQNDYEDCYEDTKFTGKLSGDIEQNSCTWLAARAMEIGSESQKEIMKECYGNHDPDCVMKVKQIYNDLGHNEYYKDFKIQFLETKSREILELDDKVSQKVLPIFLKNMFDNI